MSQQDYSSLPADLRPISPWAYIGLGFLMTLFPILGPILVIVLSNNVNVKNYGKSLLYLYIISAAIGIIGFIVVIIIMLLSGVSLADAMQSY